MPSEFGTDSPGADLPEEALARAQRLETVGRLAGMVAHDFNNILSVILGNLELALPKVANESVRAMLNTAMEATQMGAGFNRRLLTLAGGHGGQAVRFHLDAHLGQTWEIYRRVLRDDILLAFEPGSDAAHILADPAEIDAVILSHAHLDHCGYLPKLTKDGFRGKIHATEYTAKLADVILRDSARIQTEDAKYAAAKGYSKHESPKALYEEPDAIKAISQFQVEEFGQRVKVADSTFVTFHPAGHILGAAYLEVEFFGKRLLFTGDLGRTNHPLLAPPAGLPAGKYDAVITESTYGDREHVRSGDDFANVINETVDRGGSVLIPAFAVDRTEVILVQLRELWNPVRFVEFQSMRIHQWR